MVLLTPYETVEYIPGGFVTTQIPTRKYIITLLQNISLFTFAVLTATLIWHTWKKSWAIHIGIFLAVFILTCLLLF